MKMKKTALLGMTMFGMAAASQAATLYVQQAGDGSSCDTWQKACTTIQAAVNLAASGDQIFIAKGIYKISTNGINVNGKNLRFVGGFNVGDESPANDKFATVISGDVDNNDVVDDRGITLHYGDIVGTNSQRAANIGNGDFEFVNMTFTGFKGPVADHHGVVIFYANSSRPTNTLTLEEIAVLGNQSPSLGAVMMYVNSPNEGEFVMKNSLFEGNLGDAGAGLTLHNNVTKALVENTVFHDNHAKRDGVNWNRGVAALYAQSTATDLTVQNSIFTSNTAEYGAGAIFSNGKLAVINSSFSNNSVQNPYDENSNDTGALVLGRCAGAIAVHNGSATFTYNTFYNNTAPAQCAGGIRHTLATASSLALLANLVLQNTPNNITAPNAAITDQGYNILGADGVSGVSGTFSLNPDTVVPASGVVASAIVAGAGYYGGPGQSVRIVKNGPAHNKIPNDAIPFYGVGQTAEAPFVSLQQARGALVREDYLAGTYYFDLDGSYVEVDGVLTFQPGSVGAWIFSANLTAEGYMPLADLPAGYTEDGTETDGSGNIRGAVGVCSGGITTVDARGLPRSDKVPSDEPVSNCDIGAFEYNDFYRLDCLDEDGLRPENSLESAQVSWCFSDPTALTPRDILDNIGSSNGLLLIIPGLLLVLRRRRLH